MSSMFCTKIYQCKNADWCARDFNPKTNGAPSCFEPMTNADKIRQMSDEELVNMLLKFDVCGQMPLRKCYLHNGNCESCILDWLKQEVESDG